MLKILHKGFQANLPLDKTGFTGDLEHDAALANVTSIIGGRCLTVKPAGVALCDGATDPFVGFAINDAAGYFFENKPALASGIVPVSVGNQVAVSDQIDTTKTFAIGDRVYVGTGAAKGLLTNVAPAAGVAPIGVALSAASAAAPELQFVIA